MFYTSLGKTFTLKKVDAIALWPGMRLTRFNYWICMYVYDIGMNFFLMKPYCIFTVFIFSLSFIYPSNFLPWASTTLETLFSCRRKSFLRLLNFSWRVFFCCHSSHYQWPFDEVWQSLLSADFSQLLFRHTSPTITQCILTNLSKGWPQHIFHHLGLIFITPLSIRSSIW